MTQPPLIPFEPFSWSKLDLEETFRLIDAYLPIKVCRLHQIVPLSLENEILTLGLVQEESPAAAAMVQAIAGHTNFRLKAQSLDIKTYQLILSAYLNFNQSQQAQTNRQEDRADIATPNLSNILHSERKTLIVKQHPDELTETNSSLDEEKETNISEQPFAPPFSPPSQRIFGEDNEEETQLRGMIPSNANPLAPRFDPLPTVSVPLAPISLKPPSANDPAPLVSAEHGSEYSQLKLDEKYLNSPLESLRNLPPQRLWRELLSRVLREGIGRLYFEHHAKEGRILLSENGVMKGALYGLPIDIFHEVLNEFKRLAHLPPIPVDKPKKVEMEQYYQKERLLLRLRVMPGKYGEEGTLQVLRGHALGFYQQKQMDDLVSEALQLARQLERKLRHINLRSQINPAYPNAMAEMYEVMERIHGQLEVMSARNYSDQR